MRLGLPSNNPAPRSYLDWWCWPASWWCASADCSRRRRRHSSSAWSSPPVRPAHSATASPLTSSRRAGRWRRTAAARRQTAGRRWRAPSRGCSPGQSAASHWTACRCSWGGRRWWSPVSSAEGCGAGAGAGAGAEENSDRFGRSAGHHHHYHHLGTGVGGGGGGCGCGGSGDQPRWAPPRWCFVRCWGGRRPGRRPWWPAPGGRDRRWVAPGRCSPATDGGPCCSAPTSGSAGPRSQGLEREGGEGREKRELSSKMSNCFLFKCLYFKRFVEAKYNFNFI